MFRFAAILVFLGFGLQCYSNKVNCDTKFSDLVGDAIHVVCPKNCHRNPGKVCGTGHYSSDSFVCKAALHAGNLLDAVGGTLGILRHSPRTTYAKSSQHGVHSAQCTTPGHSFSFANKAHSEVFYINPDAPVGTAVGCSNILSLAGRANNCPTDFCKNGATCTSEKHHFTCTCAPGFTGSDCSHVLDSCDPSPCINGGTCVNGHNDFTCSCTEQYAGKTCQKLIDECYAGVTNSSIVKNAQMTASTIFNPTLQPFFARLNSKGANARNKPQGCWTPKVRAAGQWLNVDFLVEKEIYGVITQGRPKNSFQYSTSFKISYSNDGTNYTFIKDASNQEKIFEGNMDRNTHKLNYFPSPVRARYMRIVTHTWHIYPSFRLEYLVC